MSLLFFLCVLSMAAVTCTPYVAIATGAVTLSADAVPIPDGYVVSERGIVTFTCNSSGGYPLWRVNLTDMNDINSLVTAYNLNGVNGFNSSDESTANPASFTFHNIFFNNRTSIVECVNSNDISEVSRAIILVEGSPNCPTVHTTVTTTLLTVTIQKALMMWLPEWYCVEAVSYNGSILYNCSQKDTATIYVTPLQPGTVYNISVIPCNMAGCNESCDVHSVETESDTGTGEPGSGVILHGDSLLLSLIIGIVVAILVAMALLAILGSAFMVCLIRRRGNKQKGTAEQMKPQTQPSQHTYAETAMVYKANEISSAANNPEYAEVAHSTKSAKGQSSQDPPRQAHSTCVPGTGTSPTEYATVADAVSGEENVSRSQSPLKHTPSLPPFSPPTAPPCSSPDINVGTDCVQDAGYASLPDSQGSKGITKVRSIKQKAKQSHTRSANSPANMC